MSERKSISVMSKQDFEFKQGDKITFGYNNLKGIKGEIVGCSGTGHAVIGQTWIVRVTSGEIPSELYPFDTMAVFNCWIDPPEKETV
jgi:hypothetical protein